MERLGYGRFLSVYYANLCRYLAKHHGALPAGVARAMLLPAALTRLALLPLRRPKRASTRTAAAGGLIELARSAGSGFPEAGPGPPASTPTDEPAEGTRAP